MPGESGADDSPKYKMYCPRAPFGRTSYTPYPVLIQRIYNTLYIFHYCIIIVSAFRSVRVIKIDIILSRRIFKHPLLSSCDQKKREKECFLCNEREIEIKRKDHYWYTRVENI